MAKRRTPKNWDESAIENVNAYGHYLQRLYELSISMFEWEGLPDTCDPRYLEVALFWDGWAIGFEDEVMGPLTLRCLPQGFYDVYGVPVRREGYGYNGYRKPNLDPSNSVIIYNNLIRTNSYPMVVRFAKRLWNLDAVVDINSNAHKTPVLLQGTESELLTLKNLWMKYDGNEPAMIVDKGLNINGIKVLNLNAPFVADKVHELKCQIWNEALTYLGIANISIQKQERMLMDEVMSMQGGVLASRNSRLKARQQGCDKLNQLFGWNVSVRYNQYVEDMATSWSPEKEPDDKTEEVEMSE